MTLTDPEQKTVEATVARYFEAWNETDPTRRAALAKETWTPGARSVDPLADVNGYESISEMIGGVHAQFPGISVSRTSDIDVHHDQVRFAWVIRTSDGSTLMSGVDVVRLDGAGLFADLVGFFGDLKTA